MLPVSGSCGQRSREAESREFCLSAMFILAPSILTKVLEMPLEASGNAQGAITVQCACPLRTGVFKMRTPAQIHTQLQLSWHFVCEYEYVHMTSWVCVKSLGRCLLLCTCVCLRLCTLSWDNTGMCAHVQPQAQHFPQNAVTSSALRPSRWGIPAHSRPTDKASQMKVLAEVPVQRGSELTQATGSSPWHCSLAPVGGNRRISVQKPWRSPFHLLFLQPECGLLKTPIWSSHSCFGPLEAAVSFQEKGPKTLARTTCYLYFN